MGKDLIGYNALVEDGLRTVVRAALRRVAAEGWPGSHHAYITFKTDAPGVEVPDALRTRYPNELTIVLQHQFWELDVGEESFAVTLSFNKVGQRVTVPFAALTSYADPSVKFGLQFGQAQKPAGRRKAPAARGTGSVPAAGGDRAAAEADEDRAAAEAEVEPKAHGDGGDATPEAGEEKIVALDRFRKK